MPSNHKVYQKKNTVKEEIALMRIFFCSLYVISRHFRQCPHNIVLDTGGLEAGVFFLTSLARPLFFCNIKDRAGVFSKLRHARRLFLFNSLSRVRLCWRATGAAQRG